MAEHTNTDQLIPLADDDNTEEVTEDDILRLNLGRLALPDANKNGTNVAIANSSTESMASGTATAAATQPSSTLEIEINPDNAEEKERLITQVLEVQNTLDDLSQRWDNVKEENLKLKAETQVLGQYIENLVAASSVFQSTALNRLKSTSNANPNSNSASGDSGTSSSNPGPVAPAVSNHPNPNDIDTIVVDKISAPSTDSSSNNNSIRV